MRVRKGNYRGAIIALAVCLAAVGGTVGAPAGATEESPPSAASVTGPVPSAGCGTSVAPVGAENRNITSRGVARTYIRHVPPAHNSGDPVPLVVAIHGLAEGASLHQQMTEYPALANQEGFALAFPQGLGSPAQWNAAFDSNDVALIGDILDELEATLCLDLSRIYVSGFSMGAFMASSVACVYADRVAAVAPVAGMRNPAGCAPARPVPAITFHGTADTWVPYGPTPANAAAWAARNGCVGPATEEFFASDDTVTITKLSHPCGPDAAPVDLYRITNGGHGWPGSAFSRAIAAAVGYTTFAVNATDMIWSFFQAHPLAVEQPAEADRITGRVVGPDGQPVPGVAVLAYLPSDGWIGSVGAYTDADGTFEIIDVPSGEYKVLSYPFAVGLTPEWYGGTNRATAAVVTVDGVTTPGALAVELGVAGRVTGTVIGPGGAAVDGATVWLYGPNDGWVGTAAASTDSAGEFAIDGVPSGTYRMMIVAPEGSGWPNTWFGGATRRLATDLVVEAGVDLPPIAAAIGGG